MLTEIWDRIVLRLKRVAWEDAVGLDMTGNSPPPLAPPREFAESFYREVMMDRALGRMQPDDATRDSRDERRPSP
jgi:hypothetical protein